MKSMIVLAAIVLGTALPAAAFAQGANVPSTPNDTAKKSGSVKEGQAVLSNGHDVAQKPGQTDGSTGMASPNGPDGAKTSR